MKKFGSPDKQLPPMNENDVFLMRLHLLIVVVKASIKGYPIGKFRQNAALDNALIVHKLISNLDISFLNLSNSSHSFKERVKLLSVMATAILSGSYPLGSHRQESVLTNIDIIASYAFPEKNLKLFHDILKVA